MVGRHWDIVTFAIGYAASLLLRHELKLELRRSRRAQSFIIKPNGLSQIFSALSANSAVRKVCRQEI